MSQLNDLKVDSISDLEVASLRDVKVTSVQYSQPKINPTPLGLSAFALTTFVLSLFNMGIGVTTGGPTHIIISLAFFYGGFAQLIAGVVEFFSHNTFGATAFVSYGAFWLSYAAIFIPGFGIAANYSDAPDHAFDNAVGIYMLGWSIFTLMLWFATLRSTVTMSGMFFMVTLTFFFLSGAHLSHLPAGNIITKLGGGFGLVASLLAWYNAAASLYNPSNTFIRLPTGSLANLGNV